MTYSLTSSAQISNFLSALGLGFVLGILFYVTELIRKIISDKKSAIIVQDVSFFVAASFLCFCFMQVYTDGEVRLDLILAATFGFAVLSISVGKYIRLFFDKLSSKLRKVSGIVFAPLILVKKGLSKIINKAKIKFKKHKTKSEKSSGAKPEKRLHKKLQKHKKKTKKSPNVLEKDY